MASSSDPYAALNRNVLKLNLLIAARLTATSRGYSFSNTDRSEIVL